MSKAAQFLTQMFGKRSKGPIFLTQLPNERGPGPHPQRATRMCAVVEKFVETYDAPGYAVYFGVGTLRWGTTRRCKQNLSELVCLHADLDFKHIVERGVEIKKALDRLPLPPQLINFSGHGWHSYWLFDRALPATAQNIGRVEVALRRLAHVVAGDPAVCEVARLMRLPGSHNRKNGEWSEVRTVTARAGSYPFADLERWLDDAEPVLHRRCSTKRPFEVYGEKFGGGFKPPIDVAQRLAEMTYGGPGETGIHNTQLSVTAALLSRNWDINDVVWEVLEATMRVPGTQGFDWNTEEQTIRGLCESWLEKHPRQNLFFGFEEPILMQGQDQHIILGENNAQD